MKGLSPEFKKVLRHTSKMPCKALYSPSGARLDEKQHKYRAKRESCLYGHLHDSRKESMWCVKLHEMQKEGKISLLVCEPKIELRVNDILVCNHLPDFMYFDYAKSKRCIVDVKGLQLPEWKLKYNLCKAIYPQIEYLVV